MQKLVADDPGAIVSSYRRGEGVPFIAARYRISRERVYQILRSTRKHGSPTVLQPPGRIRPPPRDAVFLVLGYRRIYQIGPRVRPAAHRQGDGVRDTAYDGLSDSAGTRTHYGSETKNGTTEMGPVRAEACDDALAGRLEEVTIDGTVQWLIALLDDASRSFTWWAILPERND